MARIPAWVLKPLARRAIRWALGREPDHVIGGHEDPYLERWFAIPRNRWFNVYVHRFCRSDDDRALHDHPWINCSVLLEGSYVEHTSVGRTERKAGEVKIRSAKGAHRIELTNGRCWTLFITGPRMREWGFHCPQGWRHWREFTAGPKGETVGKGCDD